MQRGRIGMLIALTVALGAAGTVMAQEPSVVTPKDLNAARAVERNTYHDEQFGFSITKPEEWSGHTDFTDRTAGGLYIDDGESDGAFRGIPVVITRFQEEENKWVLINPRVTVQVYEIVKPVPPESESLALDDFIRKTSLNLQVDAKAQAHVLLPPTAIEIGSVVWKKFGVSAKLTSSQLAEGKRVDVYFESYCGIRQHHLFMVNFVARMVDVPLYRQEVDGMIRSIVFEDGDGKKDGPGAKTEL